MYFASLNDPRGHRLLAGRSSAVYAPPSAVGGHGHLLFLRDTTLMAQPFDEGKLQLAGDPVAVAEHASNNWSGGPLASASANGILVYGDGPDSRDKQLTWFDRTGKEVGKVGSHGDQRGVTLSPDGRTVLTYARTNDSVSWVLRNRIMGSTNLARTSR